MPQPYNYNVELFNPMNAFAGYNQGRNDLRAEQQQKKSDAFAQYLPGALEGDKAALEQANANASPEQIMQLHSVLKQKSKEELAQIMQQNDIVGGLLSGVKDDASLANAKRIAVEQFGMPQERVAAITLQDVPALVEQSQSAREAIEAHLKAAEYQDRHRMANANVAQSYAAADASRANAEFTREGKVKGGWRPLPQQLQRSENEMLEKVQIASNNNADVTHFIGQIDNGELDPQLLYNKYADAKSFLGTVDPNDINTRNYSLFVSTMERLRNESLRLNKGVQTEGDAQRAWNELFKNINDKTIVRDQLARIANLNARAARQHASLVVNQRKNFYGDKYQELDWAELGIDPALVSPPQKPQSFVRGAGIFSNDAVGQSIGPAQTQSGLKIERIK